MNKSKIFLIFLLMLFWGCQSNPQKVKTGDIIKIDISKDYPKIDKKDRDFIADKEYVPLETNKDILVDAKKAYIHYVSEKYLIVIVFGRRWEIFVFNRKGKIVTSISRTGKGPEEYTAIRDLVFDEKNGELFVFDGIGTGRVVVYSLTGEYRRTLKYSTDFEITQAYEFDRETMLVYDTKGMYNNTYNKKPYMLMSKKDGNILSVLNINLPVRYDTKVFTSFTDPSGQLFTHSSTISISNRRHYGQDFVLSDVSSDTIYLLHKNRSLTPLIVRTPSVHSTDPHSVCTTPFITDKYIVLYITTLDYVSIQKGKAPPAKYVMYEFETGETAEIDSDYRDDLKILQKDIDASLIDAAALKDAYEKKKLTGTLEQLAATIDEEDNPIVRIIKFK